MCTADGGLVLTILALPLEQSHMIVVVLARNAATHAAVTLHVLLVFFERVTVAVIVLADRSGGGDAVFARGLRSLRTYSPVYGLAKCARLDLLVLLVLQQFALAELLALNLHHLFRVLVQVHVHISALLKALVAIGNELAFFLYLFDFLQVTLQLLAGTLRVHPLLGLFNDFLDHVEANDLANVGRVVRPLEQCVLRVILKAQKVEQLQPQVFQLVRIVLEQLEVVADCREDFVKFGLQLAVVLRDEDLLDLGLLHALFKPSLLQVGTIGQGLLHADLLLVYDDEPVFFGVFLEFVFDCSDDPVDLLTKKFEQRLSSNFWCAV